MLARGTPWPAISRTRARLIVIRPASAAATKTTSARQMPSRPRPAQLKVSIFALVQDAGAVRHVARDADVRADQSAGADLHAGHRARIDADARVRAEDQAELHPA